MVLPVVTTNATDLYEPLRDAGVNTHSFINLLQQEMATGNVTSRLFLNTLNSGVATLQLAENIQAQLNTNPGLKASVISYVQQISGDPTLNVTNELNTSMSAMANLVTEMVTEYPKDANGFLLDRQFSPQGVVTYVTIPASSLANTANAMTAWLATIS